jgi:2-polyprenyl-3-methyl-5-hydroxy-6-metoxy-1,4-benzoquinol methylase
MPATKEAEQQWHDAWARAYAQRTYTASPAEFMQRFERLELTNFCDGGKLWWADVRREALESILDIRDLRILDYGCGMGTLGVYLSLRGARVWGFDLSGESAKVAAEAARSYGVSAQFEQADAESLSYPDDFFDLVIGFGVLHHVIKYPRTSSELHRVMKPHGRAIFAETLWDNPFINFARRFTGKHQDAGDAHLTEHGIREFSRNFCEVRIDKRHLLYMAKRLVRLTEDDLKGPLRPRPFWRLIKSMDELILCCGPLRRYCGEAIVTLAKSPGAITPSS